MVAVEPRQYGRRRQRLLIVGTPEESAVLHAETLNSPSAAPTPDGAAHGEDEQCMLRYRDGDLAAFACLYARHKDGLYRYLLRGTAQPELAAELFQDVWAGLIRSRAAYEPRARFNTYLYRLAHHRLIDHWRRSNARAPEIAAAYGTGADEDDPAAAVEPAGAEHERPEQQLLADERRRRLQHALAGLPVEQRDAFLLHEEGGLSLQEIAEIAGVGRETIKSRLRYALAKLREALADVGI